MVASVSAFYSPLRLIAVGEKIRTSEECIAYTGLFYEKQRLENTVPELHVVDSMSCFSAGIREFLSREMEYLPNTTTVNVSLRWKASILFAINVEE